MEFVKDVYFNTDKLVENTNVKVSYTGKFYQENNEKVFFHYGYGENWNNSNELEMKKTDLGYQTEFKILDGGTLNFCFKNQNNEWDNNSGKNYIFDIEKAEPVNAKKTNTTIPFFGKVYGKVDEPNPNNFNNNYNEADAIFPNGNNSTPTTEFGAYKIPNKAKATPVIEFNSVTPRESENSAYGFVGKNPHTNLGSVGNSTVNNNPINSGIVSHNPNDNPNLNNVTPINNYGLGNTKFGKNGNNYNASSDIPKEFTQKVEIPNFSNTVNRTNSINGIGVQPGNTFNNATTKNVAVKQENAIALAPTGFNYWTKKIKETVCKFFDYIPKLISGNYRRNLSNKNDNSK